MARSRRQVGNGVGALVVFGVLVAGLTSAHPASADGDLLVSTEDVQVVAGDDGGTVDVRVANAGDAAVRLEARPASDALAGSCKITISDDYLAADDVAVRSLTLPGACKVDEDDGIRLRLVAMVDETEVGRAVFTATAEPDGTDEWGAFFPNAIAAIVAALVTASVAVWAGVRRGRRSLVRRGAEGVEATCSGVEVAAPALATAKAAAAAAKTLAQDDPQGDRQRRAELVAELSLHLGLAREASATGANALSTVIAGATDARAHWLALDLRPAYRGSVAVVAAEEDLDAVASASIETAAIALDVAHRLANMAQRTGVVATTKVVEARTELSLLLSTSHEALLAPLRRSLDAADATLDGVTERLGGSRSARKGASLAEALAAAQVAADTASRFGRRCGQIHSVRQRLTKSFDVVPPPGDPESQQAERAAAAVATHQAADTKARATEIAGLLAQAVEQITSAKNAATRSDLFVALGQAGDHLAAARAAAADYGWPAPPKTELLDGAVVAHPVRRSLSQLKAGWSFADSWATNVTVGVTLLTTFLTASDVLDSILGEAPKDWLGALAVVGAVGTALGAVAVLLVRASAASNDKIRVVPVASAAVLTLIGTYLIALTSLSALRSIFPDHGVVTWIGWLALVAVLASLAVRSLARIIADEAPPAEVAKPSETEAAATRIVDALGALTRAVSASGAAAAAAATAASGAAPAGSDQAAVIQSIESEAAAMVAPITTEVAAMSARDVSFTDTFDVAYRRPPEPVVELRAAIL